MEGAERESGRWREIWARRDLPGEEGSTLARLLRADGYDTGFGTIAEASWRAFVERRAVDLGIDPGMLVHDVGCGAGAFLYPLWERGCRVGGIDFAEHLVELARHVMPDGSFDARDAIDLDVEPPADIVISCGVFFYFPSHGYAAEVIERMVARATHAVGIFDLPDAALEQEALAHRRAASGGDAAYAARYTNLEHRYFERGWVVDRLREAGLVRAQAANQDIAGYENGRFRFNAWGFKP